MRKTSLRQVLVLLDLIGAPRCDEFAGVYQQARARYKWDLRLLQPCQIANLDERLEEELSGGRYDGIITSCGGMRDLPAPLRETDIPLVAMGVFSRHERKVRGPAVFLHPDDEEMGRFAAATFLQSGGFRAFGFMAYPGQPFWSRLRSRGFAETIRKTHAKVQRFEPAATAELGSRELIERLAAWLGALPRPVALLAANDACATAALEAARLARLKVPESVNVLGVDNDELLCESASPALTSISPGNGRIGERAAEELERMMKSRPHGGVKAILTDYHTLVERESTRAVSPVSHLINRAQDFIRKNACSGITVPDVVAHLRISRRLADLRFSEYCNETIQEAITRTRLDCLCAKLSSTSLPIKSITLSCGFKNDTSAKHLFQRRFGMSMREWREKSKRTAH